MKPEFTKEEARKVLSCVWRETGSDVVLLNDNEMRMSLNSLTDNGYIKQSDLEKAKKDYDNTTETICTPADTAGLEPLLKKYKFLFRYKDELEKEVKRLQDIPQKYD